MGDAVNGVSKVRIFLTAVTCEKKAQKINLLGIDTEKRYCGPSSCVTFDNGGEFTVSVKAFLDVKLGKTYKVYLEEIEPELASGVSSTLIVV